MGERERQSLDRIISGHETHGVAAFRVKKKVEDDMKRRAAPRPNPRLAPNDVRIKNYVM